MIFLNHNMQCEDNTFLVTNKFIKIFQGNR